MKRLGIIVTPGQVVMIQMVGTDLKDLQDLVGGYIEEVRPSDSGMGWHAYACEDGLSLGMAYNDVGTMLAHMMGWSGRGLVGNVVFLGQDSGGGESDVPLSVLEALPVLFNMAGRTS